MDGFQMTKYFLHGKAVGSARARFHHLPRACLQASPCPGQFCPSLRSGGNRAQKGTEKDPWTEGGWGPCLLGAYAVAEGLKPWAPNAWQPFTRFIFIQ